MKNQINWHEILIYDQGTGIFTWKVRPREHLISKRGFSLWNTRYSGKVAGSVHATACGHRCINITVNNKKYKAHRIAWAMVYGSIPDGMTIDHIDQNSINNSINNLRLATEQEQKRNYPVSSRNSSGHVGIDWCKKSKKWRARITVNRKNIEVGSSHDISEAIKMRKDAELKHGFHINHGQDISFARQLRKESGQ